jgi:hypothetical protein
MLGRKITMVLLAAVVAGVNLVQADGLRERHRPVGLVISKGAVRIDRQPVPASTVAFAGDVLATSSGAVATVNFKAGSVATLAENSEAVLAPDSSRLIELRRGALVVRTQKGRSAQVKLPEGSVLVESKGAFPAICRIAYVNGGTAVVAQQGRVELLGPARARRLVAPGETLTLAARPAQQAGQRAGAVSHGIPEHVIQREGQTAEVQLRLKDIVNWEDVVRTLQRGRVRIALDDGSFLNIGARSSMRVTRHDPQTQQTEVELRLGRLRGEVVKRTQAGGSFQVRTQTAVIGVVGTIFFIEAFQQLTRVYCLEGVLTVQNINPAIVGQVTLQAGQSTTVPQNGPPSAPAPTSSSEFQNLISQTSAGEPISGLVAQVNQLTQTLVTTPGQLGSLATQTVTTVASGASGVLGGVAASTAGDAVTAAGAAGATAGQAAAAAAAAADAANQAAAAANAAAGVTGSVLDTIDAISPTLTECRCIE